LDIEESAAMSDSEARKGAGDVPVLTAYRRATSEAALGSAVRVRAEPAHPGRVLLLNVDGRTSSLLTTQAAGNLRFDDVGSTTQLFVELEHMQLQADAMVVGVQLRDPVRVAQRVRSIGKDISIIILSDPEHCEPLKQALKFAPFIGKDVTPWSTGALDDLPRALQDAVTRAQKRRSYSGTIAAAQQRLGELPRERPQVTHYLDRLLDRAPIGVLNVDVSGIVLDLNRRASQILKLTEREALGTPLTEYFPQSQRDRLRSLLAQCVAPAKQHSPQVFDVSESVGVQRYVEVMVSSLVDRTGQLGAMIMLQDVTARISAEQERYKAEEALRLSERRYRELVQTMSEALAVTDDRHFITYVNQSFCDMFGYASEDVIGRHLLAFVHDDDMQMMREKMANPMQTPGVQRYETAWITKDGSKIYTLTSPKQIIDPEKGQVGCLGIFTDITERKQIEAREKQHLMELAHMSRVTTMGEMSSQIAHELAQPLSAIAGLSAACVKMLKGDACSREELLDSILDVSTQAKRAREIVIRLRNFVRNEKVQQTSLDMNDLVRTVVRLANVEARYHNLPVKLELTEPLPETLGDQVLLEQVVLNLVRNAIDAMQSVDPGKRKLTIRTAVVGRGALEVAVSDTGTGIADDIIGQIFEPFVTTKTDGMGMGLAITQSIVAAHGGKLSVQSNRGPGVTFRFTLPVESVDARNPGP